MVFPISDDNSDRTIIPYVNYVLIGINVLVFVLFQGMGTNDKFTYMFSTVPERIVTGDNKDIIDQQIDEPITGNKIPLPDVPHCPIPVYFTLLTSMFLHGSIMHILGNMWFLWIFGDNIENYLGHLRYAIFYLVCGVLASLAHVASTYAFDGNPYIPSLGASGAISGVLGAYILLYPFRRVTVILFRILTQVPAIVAIGIWFAFQLIAGIGVFGSGAQAGGGVAYGAHIGGFLAGVMLIYPFAFGLPKNEPPPSYGSWGQDPYRR